MKYKNGCFNRITIAVLIVILALSLMCTLSFWLEEWFNFNNPVTNTLQLIYWRVYPVWISVIIAFANVLCAIVGIQLTYKARKTDRKPFVSCLIYASISLAAFITNSVTAYFIFGCVIVSV